MPTDAAALGTDDAERAAAATAFSSGRYTEALQRFTAMLHATAEQPHEQAPILNNRSATHLKLGHPEAAIADASRAVALARTFGPSAIAVKANYRHACALLADDRAMEALQAVDEAACVAKQQPMPAQLTELRERCVAKLVEQSGTKWLQPPNPRPAASTAASATSASSKMRVTSRRLPPSPSPTDRPPLPRTPAEGERRAERTDCEGTAAASFAGAPWWRRALLRTWRPLGTALGTARVRPLVRRLLWRLGGWWRSLHGSLGRLALGWSSSGGGSWAGGSSAGAEACGEALGEGQQAARADECAACGAGALPSAASLGGVPSDLLDACLEPLGLLERLQCKCVSHAMAEAARRLLAAPEAARVVPGTYIVVTRRKAVHPSQVRLRACPCQPCQASPEPRTPCHVAPARPAPNRLHCAPPRRCSEPSTSPPALARRSGRRTR